MYKTPRAKSYRENYVNVGQLKYKTIEVFLLPNAHESGGRKLSGVHSQVCQTLSVINKLGSGYWQWPHNSK